MQGQSTQIAKQGGERDEEGCLAAHHTLPRLLITPLWNLCSGFT